MGNYSSVYAKSGKSRKKSDVTLRIENIANGEGGGEEKESKKEKDTSSFDNENSQSASGLSSAHTIIHTQSSDKHSCARAAVLFGKLPWKQLQTSPCRTGRNAISAL